MACINVRELCDKLIISTAVNFGAGVGLLINIPAGSYNNGDKYCIVIAQPIPDATTITAPVYITIGTGTTQYPLIKKDCTQVTACGVRTRTKYSTKVITTADGGAFKLLGDICCQPDNQLPSIDGT